MASSVMTDDIIVRDELITQGYTPLSGLYRVYKNRRLSDIWIFVLDSNEIDETKQKEITEKYKDKVWFSDFVFF